MDTLNFSIPSLMIKLRVFKWEPQILFSAVYRIGETKRTLISQEFHGQSDSDHSSASDFNDIEDSDINKSDDENSTKENGSISSREKEMSVEYLENEIDVFQSVEDWDVAYGEFCGQAHCEEWNSCGSFETVDPPNKPEERLRHLQEPLEQGSTIIYVPTRKETLSIAKYLCKFGVKAAAYNAKVLHASDKSLYLSDKQLFMSFPSLFFAVAKSHLRRVHKEFHENSVEVVVATMAFGMWIDKLNVRRTMHYGWPQVYLLVLRGF
ncbi:hypothetical protein REPUB_Repub16aG0139700 [Reevesia pubescens]